MIQNVEVKYKMEEKPINEAPGDGGEEVQEELITAQTLDDLLEEIATGEKEVERKKQERDEFQAWQRERGLRRKRMQGKKKRKCFQKCEAMSVKDPATVFNHATLNISGGGNNKSTLEGMRKERGSTYRRQRENTKDLKMRRKGRDKKKYSIESLEDNHHPLI